MQLRSHSLLDANTPQPASRKRRHDSEEPPVPTHPAPQPTRLTRARLAEHDRAMRKSARLQAGRVQDSHVSASTSNKGSQKTTTTEHVRFANTLHRNNVKVKGRHQTLPPQDVEDIRHMLAAPRASLSPSETSFEFYSTNLEENDACQEEDIRGAQWNQLAKRPPPPYHSSLNVIWSAFAAEDAPINANLSAPKPGYGMYRRMHGYPDHAFEALGGYIQPNVNRNSATPHFVAQMKSAEEDISTAFHQAAHVGAAVVASDQRAFDYVGQTLPSGSTRAISAQYNGHALALNAHYYRADDAHDASEYCAYRLDSYLPDRAFDEYKRTRRAVRNAQDFGRKQSDEIHKMLSEQPRPSPRPRPRHQ